MSSDDYLRGIRKAQIIQRNGGNPNFIHGANPFEQAGVDAVRRSYNRKSEANSKYLDFVGKIVNEYKELSEEYKKKAEAAWFVIALFVILILSAL